MKSSKTVLVILFLFTTLSCFSQWTTDPANPMVAGSAANIQSNVQSLADGSGGLFTFWRDSRIESGKFDIYGQHYNAEGIAQWTENGKVIIDGLGNIQGFHIIRTTTGDLLIGWIDFIANFSSDNGIFAQRLNSNGETLWASDLLMKTGNSSEVVNLIESAGNYYVCMEAVVIGGADKIYMNKFTLDGSLLWPLDEYNITYATFDIGRVSATSDEAGGVYVYYSTGNGSGASLLCNHMSGSAPDSNLWSAWMNVTSGTAGLGYQFSAIGDPLGITLCWVGAGTPNTSGTNIYSIRLMIATGENSWADGIRNICVADGNQSNFYWKKSGLEYYITWGDGRPGVVGNYAIYARKFNTAGVVFWDEDGVEAANLNTYIPYPEFDLDATNTMTICHKAGSGFVAHEVHSDGTVDWGPDGELVFINNFSPFYGDFNIVFSEGKFLAISAKTNPSGGADGIYIAQIVVQVVQITENVTACNSYAYAGQTYDESGTYTINLPGDTTVTLNLTIYDATASFVQVGNTLVSENEGFLQWFDCDAGLPVNGALENEFTPETSGNYALILNNGPCADTSACMPVIITGLDETQKSIIQLYPNPGSESLTISMDNNLTGNGLISFYDVQGRLAKEVSLCESKPCTVAASDLRPGVYIVKITADRHVYRSRWIKM